MKRFIVIISTLVLAISLGVPASRVEAQDVKAIHQALEPLARIDDEFEGSSKSETDTAKPIVVLIQDLHAQPEAQLQIEKILVRLEGSSGPAQVLMEGGTGPADGEFFQVCPFPDAVRSVLLPYVDRAELSGAELAATRAETRSQFEGMENWKLYNENRIAMQQGSRATAKKEGEIKIIQEAIQSLKSKYFSEELKAFEAARDSYLKDENDVLVLTDFLKGLSAKRAVPERDFAQEYPALYHLAEIRKLWTPQLDEMAENEKVALMRELESFYGAAPQDTSDGALIKGASYAKIRPELFTHFEKRTQYKTAMQATHETKFLSEMSRLEHDIPLLIFKTPKEKLLFDYDQKYLLLNKLLHFELSRSEYGDLKQQLPALKPMTLWQSLTQDFPEVADRTKPDLNNFRLDPYLSFYELAIERESAFIHNIRQSLQKKQPVAVVVGGFHSEGILRVLKQENISYLSLVPRVKNLKETNLYFKLMIQGQYSYLSETPNAAAHSLALAAVLCRVSNPKYNAEFMRMTGIQIADTARVALLERDPTLQIYRGKQNGEPLGPYLEKAPYQVLDSWMAAAEASVEDQERLHRYRDILTGLYLRTMESQSAKGEPALEMAMTKVNQIFTNLFHENGVSVFSQDKTGLFLGELQALAREKHDFTVTDVMLLIYGIRWNIYPIVSATGQAVSIYEQMALRYRKYLRFEPLPSEPNIPISEYERLNKTMIRMVYSRGTDRSGTASGLPTVIQNPAFIAILEKNQKKTLRQYLIENTLEDLSDQTAIVASYARFIGSREDMTLAEIEESRIKNLLPEDQWYYLKVYYPSDVPTLNYQGYDYKILNRGEVDAALQADPFMKDVYDMAISLKQSVMNELTSRYRAVDMEDETAEGFARDFNHINPQSARGERLILQLRQAVLNVVGSNDQRSQGELLRNVELPRLRGAYKEDPSPERLEAWQKAEKSAMRSVLEADAFARGIRLQDVRIDTVFYDYRILLRQTLGLNAQTDIFISLAPDLQTETDPNRIYDSFKRWLGESDVRMTYLQRLVKSQNFDWKYVRSERKELPKGDWHLPFSLVSDLDFNKRWLPAFAFQIRYGFAVTHLDPLNLPEEDSALFHLNGQYEVFIMQEWLQRLARLIRDDRSIGSRIASHVLEGIWYEEMGHLFPTENYDPFLPFPSDLREKMNREFRERGWRLEDVEGELRMSDFDARSQYPLPPKEIHDNPVKLKEWIEKHPFDWLKPGRTNIEETLARLFRGGYLENGKRNIAKLIEHEASLLFVNYGYDTGCSLDFFRFRVRDFFDDTLQNYSWAKLLLTPDETQGELAIYRGNTYAQAIEHRAAEIFKEWRAATGKSLGNIMTSDQIQHDISDVLSGDYGYPKLLTIFEAAREGVLPETPKNNDDHKDVSFLKQKFPQAYQWYRERKQVQERARLFGEFYKNHPLLRPDVASKVGSVRSALGKTPFAQLLQKYSARAIHPSQSDLLPETAPEEREELEQMLKARPRKQVINLFLLPANPNLGQWIGDLKKSNVGTEAYDALNNIHVKRLSREAEIGNKLKQELVKAKRLGWGVSIFTTQTTDLTLLSSVGKGDYVILNAASELKKSPWLREGIIQIGFLLPALDVREAQKLRKELDDYGLVFKQTDRGLYVSIGDLKELLEKIGTEFEAAYKREIAA